MNTSSTTPTYIADLWKAVYGHLRARGCSHFDAEEVTQETFCRLASREKMEWVESGASNTDEAGKIRNYVLVVARNLHCDRLTQASAQKRGAQFVHLSANDEDIPEKFHPATETTPIDEVEMRELHDQWNREVAVLEREAARRGQKELFELMRASLEPGYGHGDYDQAADRLGCKRRNVRVQARRWRTVLASRVRSIVESEIAA